jgi:hypothetical protein
LEAAIRPLLSRYALLLLVAVTCGQSALVPAVAAESYSLRGIRLGILLADFKIMQTPDQNIWPGAKPLCSDDPAGRTLGALSAGRLIGLSPAESKAGVVRCSFFRESEGAPATAGIMVAGAKSDISFVFVPDSTGALRLARMSATSASSNYDSIRAALRKKYGQPQSVMRGYAYDAAGGKLVDETMRWSDGVGDILLDQREENVNVELMSLEYSDEVLVAEGMKRLEAATGNSANAL